ncbi:MAG: CIS tube protein [Bacteroidota bacterium]
MNHLTIIGYEVGEDGPSSKKTDTFEAQVNPASIQTKYAVNYDKGEDDGEGAAIIPERKFTGCSSQQVSFELLLDGTGALSDNQTSIVRVKDQVELFKKTCYYYVGGVHEVPYVKIKWGDISFFKYNNQVFYGRIKNFDVNYTLFSSEGVPLRAKINATFIGTVDPGTEAAMKDKQSPDLTHVVTVKAGDNLPMLCEEIYGRRQMFHEVAKVNNLISFRDIKPGTELVFPPIK